MTDPIDEPLMLPSIITQLKGTGSVSALKTTKLLILTTGGNEIAYWSAERIGDVLVSRSMSLGNT